MGFAKEKHSAQLLRFAACSLSFSFSSKYFNSYQGHNFISYAF